MKLNKPIFIFRLDDVGRYLLAKTMRDGSILMTISRGNNTIDSSSNTHPSTHLPVHEASHFLSIVVSDSNFFIRAAVVDLDLKRFAFRT